jgi:ABC-type multidrug transport system ATPase subunit
MELKEVAFRYRRNEPWVLQNVDLTLPRGRIVEVTGPNGAGKSTLLRLMAGLLHPRRGSITGRPAVIGYSPERFPAAQPFTVAAYLGHLARMRGLPETVVAPWAERLAFTHLLGTRLPDLSKGSAHKVGLAQALLPDPGFLILDEPFAGLDADTRAALPSLLAELAGGGTTVVVSDHQRCLADLPDVDRLRVDRHTVSLDERPGEHAVIEVVVPLDHADAATRRLRADGYTVRGVRR